MKFRNYVRTLKSAKGNKKRALESYKRYAVNTDYEIRDSFWRREVDLLSNDKVRYNLIFDAGGFFLNG